MGCLDATINFALAFLKVSLFLTLDRPRCGKGPLRIRGSEKPPPCVGVHGGRRTVGVSLVEPRRVGGLANPYSYRRRLPESQSEEEFQRRFNGPDGGAQTRPPDLW